MNLRRMFEPRTMAIIGVSSTNDRHPANVIYNKNHLRYPVRVFAVSPRGGELQGKKVYTCVGDIPDPVDLAVIGVRSEHCLSVLRDCIAAGVGGAVVISAGFAEVGRRDLQDEMVALARQVQFPFIGPNCLGFYAPAFADTFFLPIERMIRPETGHVAIVSQSGGVLVDQMVKFAAESVGLSLAVSIGNKALLGETDLLRYLAEDEQTRVIAYYLEGFEKNGGRRFVETVATCPKPVIVLKAGKSAAGRRAVSSHTAALAGDYETFSAIMTQFGIVEAQSEFEMVAFCEALSCYRQAIAGNIGMITGSGGHGALSVDMCVAHGLNLPPIDADRQAQLTAGLNPSIREIAALSNPLDLTGSAVDEDFVAAGDFLSRQPEIDCVMILLLPYSPGITSDLGARLSRVYHEHRKPLVAYVPHVEKYRILIEGFELNGLPVSQSIEGAVQMAAAMKRCKVC